MTSCQLKGLPLSQARHSSWLSAASCDFLHKPAHPSDPKKGRECASSYFAGVCIGRRPAPISLSSVQVDRDEIVCLRLFALAGLSTIWWWGGKGTTPSLNIIKLTRDSPWEEPSRGRTSGRSGGGFCLGRDHMLHDSRKQEARAVETQKKNRIQCFAVLAVPEDLNRSSDTVV